MRWIALGDLA